MPTDFQGRSDFAGSEIAEIYSSGFVGAIPPSPVDTERLLDSLPYPIFADIADLRGSGAAAVALLYRPVLELCPSAYSTAQTEGDCVSHGGRNAVDATRVVEFAIKGEPEGWQALGATEVAYGSRPWRGDGWTGEDSADWFTHRGGIILRQPYPELGYDFSTYDGSKGQAWGGGGLPGELIAEARKHPVGTASLVETPEAAADALANGYAISCCSNIGFEMRRDSEGFARPSGSWAHCMAWLGVDTKHSRKGFCVVNSWGDNWIEGPRRHDQPPGSFWIDWEVAAKMLRQRDTYAYSNVKGFPPQSLPDWGHANWG